VTTTQYKWVVGGQITAISIVGLVAVVIFAGAAPRFRVRQDLREAINLYETGTLSALHDAQDALDRVLEREPEQPVALALLGQIRIDGGRSDLARDTFEGLGSVLSERGMPTTPASNGLGCALVLEARRTRVDTREKLENAYREFLTAAEQDPTTGDAHVNAAIAALHLGDSVRAAGHLAKARETRSLSHESLVAYCGAVGAMLAEASAQGRTVTARVAERLNDPDPTLRDAGRMLFRASDEFDKVKALYGKRPLPPETRIHDAFVKARLLTRAPLNHQRTKAFRGVVSQALSAAPQRQLTARQREVLALALGTSHYRRGQIDQAVRRLTQAVSGPQPSGDVCFHAAVLLDGCAEKTRERDKRAARERRALDALLKALKRKDLPAPMRFSALSILGANHRRQGDPSGAAKHMREAEQYLEGLTPSDVPPARRASFYRAYGFILYGAGEREPAVAALRTSIELDGSQGVARTFLAQIEDRPLVTDFRTPERGRLPPNTPIVAARVTSRGPTGVQKKDIQMTIDGEPVAFTVGPDSWVYALPRRELAEGEHRVVVTVSPPGREAVTAAETFEVNFEGFRPRR